MSGSSRVSVTGVASRCGKGTDHPGTGQLTSAELGTRTIVNHSDAVYLGKQQCLCPQPEETDVDRESLVALLCGIQAMGKAWAEMEAGAKFLAEHGL